MRDRPIRLLMVEDNVDQLLLTQRAFKRFDPEIQVVSVNDGQQCLERLAHEDFSVVVLDYSLPQVNGMEVLKRIRISEYDVPIIMVTGQGDEKVAVEAMKNGAYDYVIKTQSYLKSLPGIVERALEKHDLQTKLKASEQKYKRLTENASDLIFTTDNDGIFTFLTNRVASVLGYPAEELLGKNFKSLLLPESKQRAEREFSVEAALQRIREHTLVGQSSARSGHAARP